MPCNNNRLVDREMPREIILKQDVKTQLVVSLFLELDNFPQEHLDLFRELP